MNDSLPRLLALVLLPAALPAVAVTRYVDANSTNSVPPYTNWATAANVIQDAVDAADPGDDVLVTNGVYATGGKAIHGTMTNRVAVDKPLTLLSMNGPEFTIIKGYRVPGTTNGDGAIRCVYLTNGAFLGGFMLTNGATLTAGDDRERAGGGLWCESSSAVISNCVISGNRGFPGGGVFRGTLFTCTVASNTSGGAYESNLNDCLLQENEGSGALYSILTNCTLIGNMGIYGGGAYRSTLTGCLLNGNQVSAYHTFGGGGGANQSALFYCTLSDNVAPQGGGAYHSTLEDCKLVNNLAYNYGGGAAGGVLNRCTLVGNQADWGGGASTALLDFGGFPLELNRCLILSNSASIYGGGVNGYGPICIVNNCALIGNQSDVGGGAYRGSFNNCVVAGNFASTGGGGMVWSALNSCIVYFNSAPVFANHAIGTIGNLAFCCTTPMPTNGIGNITNAPLFVDTNGWADLRLQPDSPCINAGNNAFVTSTNDLDGNPRIVGGTVDMGAYEFQSPQSVLSYAWLQQYGLPTDGSADFAHSDADPHNNYQEWKTWTDPTDELSLLRMLQPEPGTNGTVVSWQSEAGHRYFVERADDAAGSFSMIQSNLTGQAGVTSFTDTNVVDGGAVLYRVGVE